MADISAETIIKLPNTQKFLILGAVIIAIIGSYIYFIESPSRETLKHKQEELTKLQAKYNEQQKVLANLPKFKEELNKLELELAESLKLLPNTREIPSLLTNISVLAQECGLEILLFQPKLEEVKGFYADIPVDMKIFGKYHDLGYFFDRISKLNRIVNISNIQMKSKKAKDVKPGSLEASFKAITFKFIEKAKDIGKKKGRKKSRKG